jgi:hypothetical protein
MNHHYKHKQFFLPITTGIIHKTVMSFQSLTKEPTTVTNVIPKAKLRDKKLQKKPREWQDDISAT